MDGLNEDVCGSRHPSRLQDNMMPMSPDDYKALAQYVSPRDIAVVSIAEFRLLRRAVHNRVC